MKRIKKIMALVIAMALMLSMMSISSFAADEDRTLTVTGLEEGDSVEFYQILKWADNSTTAEANGAVSGYYWAEPFATAFDKDGDHGAAKLKAAINDQNQLVMTDALAGDIARVLNGTYSTANPQTAAPVGDAIVVGKNEDSVTKTFKVDETDTATHGLYMAVITPADQDTVYNPVFVHLDSGTDTDTIEASEGAGYMNSGAAKKSKVKLEKDSHNTQDYTGDDGDTTKPGDVLDFKVTATIPGYGDVFTAPAYKMTDTLNGLELTSAASDFVIKVDGTDVDAANYTLTPAADKKSYTLEFKSDYLKKFHVAADLTVEYQAKVLEGANTNVIKEKNTVELEFSHDPTTESTSKPGGDKQYKKDVTNHYTFSIDANNLIGPTEDRIEESGSELIKIGVDKDGNPINSTIKTYSNVTTSAFQTSPLEGAEFELLDKNKNPFNPKKVATSDANGRINFTGLDAGEYYLEETKAPAGYIKNDAVVKITIAATTQEKTITEYTTDGKTWISEAEYNALGTSAQAAYQSYTYKTDELISYTVTYGNQASTYTFDHAPESKGDVDNWNITTSGEAPQSITNTKGVELPSTGGVGTTIFYIIGSILVIGAGIVMVTRRRMEAN